jgi:hypothetical protein
VTDFAELGIDVSTSRKSVDGKKTFVHQELLTDGQFGTVVEAILAGKPFSFMSNDNAEFKAMLASAEWTIPENI